jgi:cyclopropane fatty-acyl-phospholipid synthase-like methyltransferase
MPVKTENINDRFFDGMYKEAWRKTIPEGLTEAEGDFIVEMANLQEGGKVLDLMCGWGRHSVELAKRGLKVTAVDNLKDYIEEINLTSLAKDLDIESIHASVVDLNLHKQFDAVICMGNSFNFFDRDSALSILRNVASNLKPHGILIINSWSIAEIAFRYFKEKDWFWAGDYRCVLENKYFTHPSRIESEQTIIAADGSSELLKAVDYIYSLDDLQFLFNDAGLKTRALYSTPRKRKWSFEDVRIYIVAEKI